MRSIALRSTAQPGSRKGEESFLGEVGRRAHGDRGKDLARKGWQGLRDSGRSVKTSTLDPNKSDRRTSGVSAGLRKMRRPPRQQREKRRDPVRSAQGLPGPGPPWPELRRAPRMRMIRRAAGSP
jgi:hypothetical protein